MLQQGTFEAFVVKSRVVLITVYLELMLPVVLDLIIHVLVLEILCIKCCWCTLSQSGRFKALLKCLGNIDAS